MAHLSKRLLAIAVLVVLAAVTSVEAHDDNDNPTWCVAMINTEKHVLEKILADLCSPQGGVDCGPIEGNGACSHPNTLQHRTSYALDQYYKTHGKCQYEGAIGQIVHEFPLNNGGCFHHVDDHKLEQEGGDEGGQEGGQEGGEESHDGNQENEQHDNDEKVWCLAKKDTPKVQLLKIIDELCGTLDCGPIKPGGSCFFPSNIWLQASWAMNQNFQFGKLKPEECKRLDGETTIESPSTGKCYFVALQKEIGSEAQEL